MLSDEDLDRFSRQLMLADFSIEQQLRLQSASVLVVGCGGLGSPLALYLAAAGVGHLLLADGDRVERSNLQRQLLHGEADIGRRKVESAASRVRALAPDCQLRTLDTHLGGEALEAAVAAVDLVADGSDSYPTRYALNRACQRHGRPLVSAAAVRSEGTLTSFDYREGSPCYRCLYPQEGDDTALSCAESGVLGPVAGALGTLQALEVIKLLTGWGDTLVGRLLSLDLKHWESRVLTVPRREGCPDCRGF